MPFAARLDASGAHECADEAGMCTANVTPAVRVDTQNTAHQLLHVTVCDAAQRETAAGSAASLEQALRHYFLDQTWVSQSKTV